jgi:hypothetical protein
MARRGNGVFVQSHHRPITAVPVNSPYKKTHDHFTGSKHTFTGNTLAHYFAARLAAMMGNTALSETN